MTGLKEPIRKEPRELSATELLRLNDVLRLSGISRTELYRMIESGEFPRPLQLGPRMLAWPAPVYEDWVRSLPGA